MERNSPDRQEYPKIIYESPDSDNYQCFEETSSLVTNGSLTYNRSTTLQHSSCEVSPIGGDEFKYSPAQRRGYCSESELDNEKWVPQSSFDQENLITKDDESDEYSRQIICYSDKTTDRGGQWSQYSTLGPLDPVCKICFDRECNGCRYLIGFAKTRLSGGVQLKHWLSLPNVGERVSFLKKTPRNVENTSSDEVDKKKKFNRSQKMTLTCIGLVNFSCFLAMSIIAPFFPSEASEKGMPLSVSGLVFSVYALVMMIASPIFGKYMPHIGTNFMYISGIFVSGCSNILFGVLDKVSNENAFMVLCFLVRSFEALGAAAFSTASYTIILELFPDNISMVFGLIETCVGVGMSIGPAVGGGLYAIGGYGLPFFVLGAVVLINIPLSWYLLETPTVIVHSKTVKSSYKNLLSVPLVAIVSIVVVVASQAQGFIDPTLEPHLRQYNIGPEIVGLLFLVTAVAYAFFSPLVGYIIGKWETKYPMMLVGLLMMTVSLLLLGPSPFLGLDGSDLWLNILGIVLLGISFACAFIPTFEAMLIAGIDGGLGDNMSTYCIVSGFWNSMCSLGEVAGPALGGVLTDFLGFALAATVMAMFSLATAVLVLITWIACEKQGKQESSLKIESNAPSTVDQDGSLPDERTTLLKTPEIEYYYDKVPSPKPNLKNITCSRNSEKRENFDNVCSA